MSLQGVLLILFMAGSGRISALAGHSETRRETGKLSEQTGGVSFDASVPDAFKAPLSQAYAAWAEHCGHDRLPHCKETLGRSILFRFVHGDHEDGFPFQRGGLKISHVVSMTSDRAIPEVHMNSEIEWATGGGDPDVYTVALHEIGHVLGLRHSSNARSIMYPWYGKDRRIFDPELLMFQEDIAQTIPGPFPSETRASTTLGDR